MVVVVDDHNVAVVAGAGTRFLNIRQDNRSALRIYHHCAILAKELSDLYHAAVVSSAVLAVSFLKTREPSLILAGPSGRSWEASYGAKLFYPTPHLLHVPRCRKRPVALWKAKGCTETQAAGF